MRALVTGATGFLGSHLVHLLLAEGDDAAVLVRPESDRGRLADVADRLTVVEAYPGPLKASRAQIAAFAPDTVFHLAWDGVHGADRDDVGRLSGNVRLSLKLVDLAADLGCTAFVGLGSLAEYGPQSGVIDEDTPAHPTTAYGVGKLAVGLLLEPIARASDMRGVWLRLFSAYGPRDHPRYLIPYVISELLAGRVPHLTAGNQPYDTLYCTDVANALRTAAATGQCRGQYVLASGAAVTVREIAEAIRDIVAHGATLDFDAAAGHTGWRGSHQRLTRDTGWSPSVDLPAGLAKTILWWQEHADIHPDSPRHPRPRP
jgi:nucleoside-diphosphate-sugar epimerase